MKAPGEPFCLLAHDGEEEFAKGVRLFGTKTLDVNLENKFNII